MNIDARPVSPVAVLHQEGALGVLAVIGLMFREQGPLSLLAPRGTATAAIGFGLCVGAGCAALLWLVRALPAVRSLENWQRELVREWTVTDAVCVATLSGVAEEALLRALAQPLIGLVPAAALFAVLHLIPDRRLWFWPAMAFTLGLVLGVVFDRAGYPAAAAAHTALNGVGLLRLRNAAGRA